MVDDIKAKVVAVEDDPCGSQLFCALRLIDGTLWSCSRSFYEQLCKRAEDITAVGHTLCIQEVAGIQLVSIS